MELNEIWDEIVNNGIATEEELQLVTGINGYNVIYYKTGYRDIEQFLNE